MSRTLVGFLCLMPHTTAVGAEQKRRTGKKYRESATIKDYTGTTATTSLHTGQRVQDREVMRAWHEGGAGWRNLHSQAGHETARVKRAMLAGEERLRVSEPDASYQLDVVVPMFLSGPMTLRRFHSINQWLRPRPRRIYVVAATTASCHFLTHGPDPVHNLECFPENAFTPFTIPEIACAYPKLHRLRGSGWFVQQFIKLFTALADVGIADDYVIMDSDNLLVSPLHVVRPPNMHVVPHARAHAHAHSQSVWMSSHSHAHTRTPYETLVTDNESPQLWSAKLIAGSGAGLPYCSLLLLHRYTM